MYNPNDMEGKNGLREGDPFADGYTAVNRDSGIKPWVWLAERLRSFLFCAHLGVLGAGQEDPLMRNTEKEGLDGRREARGLWCPGCWETRFPEGKCQGCKFLLEGNAESTHCTWQLGCH